MKLTCLVAMLCALSCGTAQAASLHPVKVFANWSQPPKSAVDADGALQGYAIETAAAILKDAEVEHIFVAAPYPRAFEMTKMCEGVMVGVFKSPEREAFLAFSEPIMADRVTLVTRAGDPLVYSAPSDLAGKSLSYLSGAYFGIDLQLFAAAHLDQQASFETMLKKLVAHRTDAAVISPRQGVAMAASRAGIPMSALHVAEQPLAVVPNFIVACKSDPELAALVRTIDKSIVKLRNNGTFERIMKSY